MPTASITPWAAAPVRLVQDAGGYVVSHGRVDDVDAMPLRHLEPFGHEIDAEDPFRAHQLRDPCAELAHRAEAVHSGNATLGDVREPHSLPGRRQDVGQVHEAVVRRSLRKLDRAELGLRDAQVLGLAARDLAVQLRVAEQGCALALVTGLRRLALRIEAAAGTSSSTRTRC